jgi:hypothetical protein
MDKDPFLSVQEALTTDELKQRMYQSALLLLMSDHSDTHTFAYETLNDDDKSVAYVRNSVTRTIDVASDPAYEGIRRYGVKAVKLSYLPDRDNRLESVDGETVIMAVENTSGTEHILKMRIENSGHLEEIDATSTAKIYDGLYMSDDASVYDLEEMKRIADAIEVADS